jgi:hydrogenase nickel incorporation protein HypA/HybF
VHELSLSSAILETALRHAGGKKVGAVELTVGALRQVVPASLTFYFEIVSRGTVCEGARLELHTVDARVRCNGCDDEWTLDDPIFRCSSCEASDVEVITGNEFLVESIDVEEEACTAPR